MDGWVGDDLRYGDSGGLAGWVQAPLVTSPSEVLVVLHNPVVPAGNTSAVVGAIESTGVPGTNSSNGTSLESLGALTLAVEIVRCATYHPPLWMPGAQQISITQACSRHRCLKPPTPTLTRRLADARALTPTTALTRSETLTLQKPGEAQPRASRRPALALPCLSCHASGSVQGS